MLELSAVCITSKLTITCALESSDGQAHHKPLLHATLFGREGLTRRWHADYPC